MFLQTRSNRKILIFFLFLFKIGAPIRSLRKIQIIKILNNSQFLLIIQNLYFLINFPLQISVFRCELLRSAKRNDRDYFRFFKFSVGYKDR